MEVPTLSDMPVLLPAAVRYWRAWELLNTCRLKNGNDPQPLQLTEMREAAAHFAFEGFENTTAFVKVMHDLDGLYLAYVAEQKKKKPPPKR